MKWRARNEDRVSCGDWLAGSFGRRHGALVSSGTIALELALLHLGVEPGWRVVVPSTTCPQVPAAVLRCGAIPIIVDTSEDLVLTPGALESLDQSPQAVIAVHQWGLPCTLASLRTRLPAQAVIIEDAAQAWAMHANNPEDASVADVVVTSLGPHKPLSIGGGGAAFADTKIDGLIDTWSPGQRARPQPPLAVGLSQYALPHIAGAVARAEARTAELRRRVPGLLDQLSDLGLVPWRPGPGPAPSWMFVPVRARDPGEFERLRHSPEAAALGVCAPAEPPLGDIPMLKDRAIVVRRPAAKPRWLLLDPESALAAPELVDRWAKRAWS